MDKFIAAEYIAAIAETKSISAAAEMLDVSQPALSIRLKKAEEQLGTVIFDRSKQPLELTEGGKLYLEYADRISVVNRELMQRISDIEDMRQGSLTIGGASFFNVSYLPGAVSSFSKNYPGIDIEIIDGKIPEIAVKALNGMVDVFIAHPMEMDERFHYEKLFNEKIFVCVPQDWDVNRLLEGKEVSLERIRSLQGKGDTSKEDWDRIDFGLLRNMPFVILKEDQHIGVLMHKLFEKYKFDPIHSLCVEQTMTSYALTLAGAGISLMTESCIRNSGFKNFPKFYMVDPEICSRDIYVIYPKNKYLSKAASEFIEILKASFM